MIQVVLLSICCVAVFGQKIPLPLIFPQLVPDDTWYYHMGTSKDELTHFERFSELNPRSALLCPQEYYISQLQYNFHDRLSDEEKELRKNLHLASPKYAFENTTLELRHLLHVIELDFILGHDPTSLNRSNPDHAHARGVNKHGGLADVSSKYIPLMGQPRQAPMMPDLTQNQPPFLADDNRPENSVHWPGARHQLGPCPTLVYCIGHQSCSFHLSNKYCQNDPVPGWRKTLDVTFTCARDSTLAGKIKMAADTVEETHRQKVLQHMREWEEHTVQLVYDREVDHGTGSEYLPPLQYRIPEADVFHIKCPSIVDAMKQGYFGDCLQPAPGTTKTTNELWRVLARAPQKVCREELLQVYCAFKYSPKGYCYPPFTQKVPHNGAAPNWSFHVLPEKGRRLDLKQYYKIYDDGHFGLIPVRLGFFIMAHESPRAVIELLQSVYSPQHAYVIHIDKREPDVREQVSTIVSATYGRVGNVRVLSAERSFVASWGSWYINRAELECIEELLRMGVWDFAINLSGADLSLRDITDLTFMLAPYRGRSVVRFNGGKLNYSEDVPIQSVWHSCGSHVYNVTYGHDPSVNRYSHSQFGIWSRDYLEYLLAHTHREVTDQFQFRLLTAYISDEQYLGSVLMASPFNQTVVKAIYHYMKPFIGETAENLCRHSEETDSCGRGPSTYTYEDLRPLHNQLHHYFFARKFSTKTDDPTRKEVLAWSHHNAYGKEILHNLPEVLLKKLATDALQRFKEEGGKDLTRNVRINIDGVRVVPRLVPTDPCCEGVSELGIQLVEEFTYILDFTVIGRSGERTAVRASLDPSHGFSHSCYGQGHLRLVHLTTRRDLLPPPDHRPEPSMMNLPLPTSPLGGDVVWLRTMIHVDNVSRHCAAQSDDMMHQHYATWDTHDLSDPAAPPPTLTFDITLLSPQGHVLFRAERMFDTGPVGKPDPKAPYGRKPPEFNMWTTPMPIQQRESGVYTVTIKQTGIDNAYTYCQSILIVDEGRQDTYLKDEVLRLWTVSDVAVTQEVVGDKYYTAREATAPPATTVRSVKHGKRLKTGVISQLCKMAIAAAENYREPFDPIYAVKVGAVIIMLAFIVNFYRCRRLVSALKRSFDRRVLFVIVIVICLQFIYFSYSNSLLSQLAKSEL